MLLVIHSIGLFEFLTFMVLVFSVLYTFYVAWVNSDLGLYMFSVSFSVFLLLLLLHLYVVYVGFWDPVLYRFYYYLSSVIPFLFGLTALILYLGVGHRFVKYFLFYSLPVLTVLAVLVFIADLREFLLSIPYIGGHAMAEPARFTKLFISIPSSIASLVIPLRYFMKYRDRYDAFIFSLSTLVFIIAGVYLRFGSIQFFHYFELMAALGYLASAYLVSTAYGY